MFLCYNNDEYCQKVLKILSGEVLIDPLVTSRLFKAVFHPYFVDNLALNQLNIIVLLLKL